MRPSEEAKALILAARELHAAGGEPRDAAERDLLAWALQWPEVRSQVHRCVCGRLAHTTHLGAAQHACWQVLVEGPQGGAPRVGPCRCSGIRALHVVRRR